MMKKHPNHIALGIGMMMIGIWLIMNDHFFYVAARYSRIR